ncbi:hypothetical protein [Aureibaculum luteum]|uniref:hypothetical protein n=1 Tax=Aureibaculum luteum TaxID=1548456 RepID=UPI000E4D7DA4|nr:hypothetical protein [Aureibaculum luteum]
MTDMKLRWIIAMEFYMYGSNAETLFKTVQPILEKVVFMKGANVKMRFGPPEDAVKEIEVKIR